jgi:glyoxylase-like metal-dependent hydrolase (beta-lactamase superfamily II)
VKIWTHTGGLAQTNCYLIADESAKQAVLFDAPDHTVAPLLDEVAKAGWDLIGLWLTHGHFDHMADHKVVTDQFRAAKVLIHKLDEPKLQRPGVQSRMFALPFEIPPRSADALVEDGQKLQLGSLEFEVIHTPGHAPGHVMYYCLSEGVLVGGDLIICGSVGRTDLPDSDHGQLIESIRRVMKLPGTTKLLPGHCDMTTLDEERRTNDSVKSALGEGRGWH